MDNFDYKKYLAEGMLYEESIPSGWKKIDTSDEYEEEAEQGRLMGFEAPMNGIEGDEVDNIYIEQDEDEFEVHIITAFNNPEYKGPFNSKEEALKVAIQKMEDLKKDWDEDLAEGRLLKENQSPKFKIGDFVQPIEGATSYLFSYDDNDINNKRILSKYVGQIEDVYINKPENLEMKDGEYLYSVANLNNSEIHSAFGFKESDLELISDPTDYIKSLTSYKIN